MPQPSAPERDLREAVRQVYSGIAERPQAEHPLSVGRALAEGIGYPASLLDELPPAAVEAFAGISYVHGYAEISDTSAVLDLGCGAGLDSLIAARRAASVVGVDFSTQMLQRACRAASQANVGNVEFREGDAEAMPMATASVDVALVNGIFNLNPARAGIFRDLARVLRPGAKAYVAELILREPVPPQAQEATADWFA